MNELEKYKKKLEKAEHKIRILEEMIETRTRELYTINFDLERKNKELEQFTYIASHDLQEPLRTVTSHLSLLTKDLAGKLGENEKTSMRFVTDASNRMAQLIKDLLDYGRIGRNRELANVDCNVLLEEIRNDLSDAISQTKAVITSGELPTLRAYKTEIRLLFQNLISNGIKFSRPEIKPHIEISAEIGIHQYTFAVKDNGIGIAENHKERVFSIFKRLHSKRKYKGTGIGLAHCKKIVELHGGEIWVESQPEKGSTFYFTINSKIE